MLLSSMFVIALLVFQASAHTELSPEEACGSVYHEFSPPLPSPTHKLRVSLESIARSGTLVEGTVLSKKTFAGHGVENDIQFRIKKVLKGTGLEKGDVITVHTFGGFAGDNRDGAYVCLRDDQSDGMRLEVGKPYLVSLTENPETGAYRADSVGAWFLIGNNGDLVPLTPDLIHGKDLTGKKVGDLEGLLGLP